MTGLVHKRLCIVNLLSGFVYTGLYLISKVKVLEPLSGIPPTYNPVSWLRCACATFKCAETQSARLNSFYRLLLVSKILFFLYYRNQFTERHAISDVKPPTVAGADLRLLVTCKRG